MLTIADIETGQHHQLTPAGFSDSQPAWSADGLKLAVISDRGGTQGVLYQVDAVTGEGQPLTLIDDYVSLPPAWSPDGRWLAVFATHYTGRTSSIPRTYIVDVLNRSVVSRLGEYQLGFRWQP
jgi:Tol biopolymer transport system component